ncbi:MAG: YbjN domain-containing protein [Actinobacteria bacterium]|nr:YbjN domain-containing protein [Actinomycetota bacterium]MSW24250.1 YbjN domain-containing protein [Actinomycetota bacterium]MSX29116.1 YbjN domain-containing protein [Actinomycetota bacterium]MSX43019.1 YbjN domain-containing protein [Actinomycetota bacterium]MSX97284.1 YbjN domain-containing protein [Actinomycetota bacterium]
MNQVVEFLAEQDLNYELAGDKTVVVSLPGVNKQFVNVALTVGDTIFKIESFVARNPDENHEVVYRWILEQNRKLLVINYCLDHLGDIYLSGTLPIATVDTAQIDQLLGVMLQTSDNSFNVLLELGFKSAIEREWAWRTSNGMDLANLQAFAHLFE